MIKRLAALTMLIFVPAAKTAWAAGPYIVDDAGVVDPHTFQNENWLTFSNKEQVIAVTNLAYQLLPNAEFALQATHLDIDDDRTDLVSPQVKYLWWQNTSGSIASSLVLGASIHTQQSEKSGLYGYIPLTLQVADALKMHLNLGAARTGGQGGAEGNWGAGLEYSIHEKVNLIAETFGREDARPGYQCAARISVTENILLDTVYGWNLLDSKEHTGTVGLTFSF